MASMGLAGLILAVSAALLGAPALCADPPRHTGGAATHTAAANPQAAMRDQLTTCFGAGSMNRTVAERAMESGDGEVFAAAVYNELHLSLLGTNDARAESALRRLEAEGDDFTLSWLEIAAKDENLAADRARLDITRDQIRKRLDKSPLPAEKIVRERLMNAAVSDLTCSRLEVPLKTFMWRWAATNTTLPAVRAELAKLRAEPVKTNGLTFPERVRNRVNFYTVRLLDVPARQPTVTP